MRGMHDRLTDKAAHASASDSSGELLAPAQVIHPVNYFFQQSDSPGELLAPAQVLPPISG
jgi:hypothetical protein